METIYEYTQKEISAYPLKTVETASGSFNQYETINKIEAYTKSKYINGNRDSLKRRKPFHNVSNRILNKQRSAEDIDTKDIQLTTTKPDHYAKSLLMTVANKKWMKKVNFAKTLNEMTETRGKFGGVLVKKVMNQGLLNIEVIDWITTITDPVDIQSGVKIQQLKYNYAELLDMKKSGWSNVEEALLEVSERKEDNDTTEYLDVYIVNGVLPRTMIDDNANEFEYSEQMHVVVLFKTTNASGKEEQDGISLFEAENVDISYKYLPYKKLSSRSLGQGMVEASFEAQISINEAVINEKNTMDIASKTIFQQLKGNSNAKNVWTDIVDGTVIDNNIAPMTLLNATPSSLGYNRTIVDGWQQQLNNETSVKESNTGDTPASATWRTSALDNQEANSIFELRREEMGIFIKEIYTDWIIPFLKTWIKKQEFIEGELSSDEMQRVLEDYAYKTARKKVDEKYFNGEYNNLPAGQKFPQMSLDTEIEKDLIMQDLPKDKIWLKSDKKYLDGIEFDMDVLITGEQRNKQAEIVNKINLFNSYAMVRDSFNTDKNISTKLNEIAESLGQKPFEMIEQDPTEEQGKVQQLDLPDTELAQ